MGKRPMCGPLVAIAMAIVTLRPGAVVARDGELVVSAAASLADVMSELTTTYRAERGTELRVNTGGSNTLARQIVEGAKVDVFISADETQMNVVDKAGRLVSGSRTALLNNSLVVIVSADPSGGSDRLRQGSGESGRSGAKAEDPPLRSVAHAQIGIQIRTPRDLAAAGVRRVAMGNPESVPVGVYGRQWLERIGLWAQIAPKVVPLPTVRAALSAVQEGRADAGIVYATDARATNTVRVALVAPDNEAPPIVYPAAIVRGGREDEAARFLTWLRSEPAARVFTRAGFRMAAR